MRLLARLSIIFKYQNGAPITAHFGLGENRSQPNDNNVRLPSGLLGAELITGQTTLSSLPPRPRLCKPSATSLLCCLG